MKVEVEVRPGTRHTSLAGPHELAWSYLLDAVFADAFAAGIERLVFLLPDETLRSEIELRATLTAPRGSTAGVGWVTCLVDGAAPLDTVRRYRVEAGIRRLLQLRVGERAAHPSVAPPHHLSVYTGPAIVLGVLLRAAQAAGRPSVADRVTFAIRRCFAVPSLRPAYYHLTVWKSPSGWSQAGG